MKDKYVAYYAANNESETFQTFELAEKWLKKKYATDCGNEGLSEETCSGLDYIAEITHRSEFKVTQDREKEGYKWNDEAEGYFIDGNPDEEEWPYSNDHDQVGEVVLTKV